MFSWRRDFLPRITRISRMFLAVSIRTIRGLILCAVAGPAVTAYRVTGAGDFLIA